MKTLEILDILKPECKLTTREVSKEEFEPIYKKTIEAQKKILEQKERNQNPSYEDLKRVVNPYLRE